MERKTETNLQFGLQYILGVITNPEYDPTVFKLEEEREIDRVRPDKREQVLAEV